MALIIELTSKALSIDDIDGSLPFIQVMVVEVVKTIMMMVEKTGMELMETTTITTTTMGEEREELLLILGSKWKKF